MSEDIYGFSTDNKTSMNAQMGDGSINKQWCIVLQSCDEIKKLNMNLK